MRVYFIIHGGRKTARKIAAYLSAHQPDEHLFFFEYTTGREHIAPLVRSARKEAELLVIVGGDGLFSLCTRVLLQEKGPLPLLALIPSGSGNDFARNFKWISDGKDFLRRLEQGVTRRLDIGVISTKTGRDIFTNETSTGISQAVVRYVEQKPVAWSGNLKFGLSILQAFATFRKKHYTIRWDGGEWSGKAMLVACCNGRYFGSGIGIAPDAVPDDGMLNLVVIGNVHLFHYLRFLPRLRRSEIIEHQEVRYFRAKKIEVISVGNVERDGEPGMAMPVSISLMPGAIEMLM